MDSRLLTAISTGEVELDFSSLVLYYLLLDSMKEAKPELSLIDLTDLTDSFCLEHFRFRKEHLHKLKNILQIPDKLVCSNGTHFSGIEGLCIILRRLAYPNRLCDLQLIYNRPRSVLSLIVKRMVDFIYNTHGHLLQNLNHWWLNEESRTAYAAAIFNAGAPLNNCIGFIDGTVRAMCCPGKYQKEVYNGHKCYHALKFQSVVLSNGLIANLYGPVSGRRHDSFMLSQSAILPELEALMPGYCIYGDPAYPLRPQLQAPFRGKHLRAEQTEFNKRMSMHRVTVEWVFGKIILLFGFLDFKKNLKLYLQPIAKTLCY